MEQFEKNKTRKLRFEEPELRLIQFAMKDVISLSGDDPTDPTDPTDPNQGTWMP